MSRPPKSTSKDTSNLPFLRQFSSQPHIDSSVMAAQDLSFNDFIQADRKRKKNEDLWTEIRGRKKNTPGAGSVGNTRKSLPQAPSLASRMGVIKRSSSAKPNINGKWGHDLHPLNNPRAARISNLHRTASASRVERGNRTSYETQLDQSPTVNMQASFRRYDSQNGTGGINIRGMGAAGPFTVVASNFAPGTTAADIEAVMAPIGGEMINCRLVSSHPTVIAEMLFVDKDGADNVIATFNNKKADGRLLYVYLKNPPTPRFSKAHSRPEAPPSNYLRDREQDGMEIDNDEQNQLRLQSETKSAEPSYQDGRYGFNESGNGWNKDNRRARTGPGLFSDSFKRQDRDRPYRR